MPSPANPYQYLTANDTAPFADAAAVTLSDVTVLPVTRGVYVGGAGALKVDMGSGVTVTFSGLLAGQCYPIRATRFYATGSTATNVVALY